MALIVVCQQQAVVCILFRNKIKLKSSLAQTFRKDEYSNSYFCTDH